jgi:hypothetical protein
MIDDNDELYEFTAEELEQLRLQEEELRLKIEAQLENIGKLDAIWLTQHKADLAKRQELAKAFREKKLELKREEVSKARELKLKRMKLKNLKPDNIRDRRVNVSERLAALNCDPVEILAAIATGDSAKLGTDEQIRIFERRMASQELLSYIAPKFAAKQVQEEDTVETIPVFVPKRGDMVPQNVLSGDFEEVDDDD